jgi:hypothetical protein
VVVVVVVVVAAAAAVVRHSNFTLCFARLTWNNSDILLMKAGILTDRCHFEEHMFRVGSVHDPSCERNQTKHATASRVLCDCTASASQRSHCFRLRFMEPGDSAKAKLGRVLSFTRSAGGFAKQEWSTKNRKPSWCLVRLSLSPLHF